MLSPQRWAPYFTPKFFRFFRELAANNNREWFQANKSRYENDVREPMQRFIADFAPRLRKLNRNYLADPRPVGGSMFRIYRDIRFSPDKSPYKTHGSAYFHHAAGNRRDIETPGYYLHLSVGEVFVGSGLWHPESASLAKIRDAIVAHPEKWKRAVGAPPVQARPARLSGDKLQRPPKGYDPNHPLIEDLKRKDFVTITDLSEKGRLLAALHGSVRRVVRSRHAVHALSYRVARSSVVVRAASRSRADVARLQLCARLPLA